MNEEVLEKLKKAVREYNVEEGANWATKVVEKRIDPIKALDVLTKAMREIGDGYDRGEFFLPDLIGAAEVAKSILPPIEEELKRRGREKKSKGTIVAGTVFGDIHSIGITMVAALAKADGFDVIELGVNIKSEQFVETIMKYKADILAMSALLTTTAPEQKKVIEVLKRENLRDRVKIAVGGGAITEDFAKDIGANGYAPTAPLGIRLFNRFIGVQ